MPGNESATATGKANALLLCYCSGPYIVKIFVQKKILCLGLELVICHYQTLLFTKKYLNSCVLDKEYAVCFEIA